MAIDIPAHSLFSGADNSLLENVVLRHDNGIITDISESAPPATSHHNPAAGNAAASGRNAISTSNPITK